jgi:hypothetical protein
MLSFVIAFWHHGIIPESMCPPAGTAHEVLSRA